MSKLRKEARDRPCMVRVPGICTGGGEDTVLAHYRLAGYCGTGIKPPDVLGAWCCHACHDAVDGRNSQGRDSEWLRQCHAEGVLRTVAELSKEGKL
jgi:hypothetical protein